MKKITLFHGTPDRVIVPTYGKGEDKHDYGRGFYLTESIELAKEWAVDYDSLKITPAGIDYLQNNKTIRKVCERLKEAKDLVSFFI